MRQLLICIATFLIVAPANRVQAQKPTEVLFADFLERLPKPMGTLNETMEVYGNNDRMDREMKYAYNEIQNSLELVYAPLLELFKKRVRMEKPQQAGLSKEERDYIEGFRHGRMGLNGMNENVSLVVLMMSNDRPLISSGKFSWTKLNPAASAPVQKLYQQLKEVEGLFDWARFNKEEVAYRPKFGEIDDENIKTLQRNFDDALKKLPKKKMNDNGISFDIEDPEGAIKLLEKHMTSMPQAYEQWYSKRYKWWLAQYAKLEVISRRLDEIALQANRYVANDADHSLQTVLMDLQGRTWGAWQKLSGVTQGFFTDAIILASAKLQITESLKIYQGYRQSSE